METIFNNQDTLIRALLINFPHLWVLQRFTEFYLSAQKAKMQEYTVHHRSVHMHLQHKYRSVAFTLQGAFTQINCSSPLFIGGVPEYDKTKRTAGVVKPFTGVIQKVSLSIKSMFHQGIVKVSSPLVSSMSLCVCPPPADPQRSHHPHHDRDGRRN